MKYWPVLLLIGILLQASQSWAQTDKFVDKVRLTNGSVFWGLTEIEGEELKIFLNTEDSLTIPVHHIKTIKKGKLNPALYQQRLLGIYYQFTTGVLLGKSYQFSENEGSFTASFASGYKFSHLWGMGLGLAVNFYPDQRHIPVFLEFQGDLTSGRVSPYYQFRTGLSWANERSTLVQVDRLEGGFYLEPAVGVKWHLASHSWHLQFSYVRQQADTYYEPVDFGNGNVVKNVENRVFQRLGFTTGISF